MIDEKWRLSVRKCGDTTESHFSSNEICIKHYLHDALLRDPRKENSSMGTVLGSHGDEAETCGSPQRRYIVYMGKR